MDTPPRRLGASHKRGQPLVGAPEILLIQAIIVFDRFADIEHNRAVLNWAIVPPISCEPAESPSPSRGQRPRSATAFR